VLSLYPSYSSKERISSAEERSYYLPTALYSVQYVFSNLSITYVLFYSDVKYIRTPLVRHIPYRVSTLSVRALKCMYTVYTLRYRYVSMYASKATQCTLCCLLGSPWYSRVSQPAVLDSGRPLGHGHR
jgi:hypothetical protein